MHVLVPYSPLNEQYTLKFVLYFEIRCDSLFTSLESRQTLHVHILNYLETMTLRIHTE